MSDMPKVSVIVPMYNPGKMIQRGLRSLRRQTLSDIEIILVNDGSKEDTLAEVRTAAAEDVRIKILNIEINAGAGIARNKGIENASGEYLAFMDADDFISPDFLEMLYRKAKLYHADIAKGSLVRVLETGVRNRSQPSGGENTEIRSGLQEGKPLYTLFRFDHYSALYSRLWIQENRIQYGASRYGEDSTFLLRATANTKRVVFEDRACYYLVDHPGSLMTQLSAERLTEQLTALREQIDFLIERFGADIEPDYEMQRIRWTLGIQAAAVRQGNLTDKTEEFLSDIYKEVMRLPNLTELVIYSPMIGALVEYRENLCSLVMRRIEGSHEEDVLVESITRCFRFASLHPGRKDLYEAPIRESLKRATAYLWGRDGLHAKGIPARQKAAFTRRLVSELRTEVDPLFWEKNLKQWLTPKKLFSEGRKAVRKVTKR